MFATAPPTTLWAPLGKSPCDISCHKAAVFYLQITDLRHIPIGQCVPRIGSLYLYVLADVRVSLHAGPTRRYRTRFAFSGWQRPNRVCGQGDTYPKWRLSSL